MSRLPAVSAALILTVQPAVAQVCESILGSGYGRLLNAPLWYHVGDRLFSTLTFVLVALAFLTVTRFPRLRGLALIAGLLLAVRAVTAIGENAFPDRDLLAARLAGCGEASLTTAIVSSLLAIMLLGAFLRAPERRT